MNRINLGEDFFIERQMDAAPPQALPMTTGLYAQIE
jgi:hypothetical protein